MPLLLIMLLLVPHSSPIVPGTGELHLHALQRQTPLELCLCLQLQCLCSHCFRLSLFADWFLGLPHIQGIIHYVQLCRLRANGISLEKWEIRWMQQKHSPTFEKVMKVSMDSAFK